VWQKISTQLNSQTDLVEFTAIIKQNNYHIVLDIDIDLGGGFESGYETTTFSALLHSLLPFKFGIHPKHLTDEIGKFFGMQDAVVGFADFDDKMIVKTNDVDKVRNLLSDPAVRKTLLTLGDFSFEINSSHTNSKDEKVSTLQLQIESGITDPVALQPIYHAFYSVLSAVDV
jgi:hypothetical protein